MVKMMDSELQKIREKKLRDLKKNAITKPNPQKSTRNEVIEIDSDNFENIITNNEWVIIDCWAVWCMPCKMMTPIFKKLAKEYGHKVQFAKLNTDLNPQLAMKFEIMSIPTFLLVHKGQEVRKVIGAVGEPGLRKILAPIK